MDKLTRQKLLRISRQIGGLKSQSKQAWQERERLKEWLQAVLVYAVVFTVVILVGALWK